MFLMCVRVCTCRQKSEDNVAVVSFLPRGAQGLSGLAASAFEPSSQQWNLFLASEVGKRSCGSPRLALGKWQGRHGEPCLSSSGEPVS